MIKKDLSKQDRKDWKEFLDNISSVPNKDGLEDQEDKEPRRFKFDFHGYSIEDANKKIEYLISKSLEKGVKELLIITGKGTHSDKKDDVYVSKEYNKLQNTLPEFIKNNLELSSKIEKIKQAPKELGGSGAFILKLKKIKE